MLSAGSRAKWRCSVTLARMLTLSGVSWYSACATGAGPRIGLKPSTSTVRVMSPCRITTMSCAFTSREGLATRSLTWIRPLLISSVASERVLKNLAAQSHVSIRMEFMGTGMLSTLGCGCCCLAVVAVVGVAGILGMRRSRNAEGAVGGVPDAPARGSSTNARLTHMEHAPAEPAGQFDGSADPDLEGLPADGVDLRAHLYAIEHRLISEALERSGGTVAHAARLLSLRRTTLVEKLRKFGMAESESCQG